MTIAFIIAIFLSLLVAMAELFSKFRDEPFYVLKQPSALIYIAFNIGIAVISLVLISKTDFFDMTKELGWIKSALTAGLGSAALMRSKFFKVTMDGKETAIGPEFIINIFLETLERLIDRERARRRKDLVENTMMKIDFSKAKQYVVSTIIASSQLASNETPKKLMKDADSIEHAQTGGMEKSLALGYLILDFMGEKFLKTLFHDENLEQFSVRKPDFR